MKQFYPAIICLFFAVVFSLPSSNIEAQNYALDRIYQQGYPRINDYQSQNVVFYFYEYESENLDLRHFRLSNPLLRLLLPAKVKVKLPPLNWAKDTTYAVGYISNEDAKDGSLVLMIIKDANTSHPTFFVDSDLDRDFTDEKPIVFPNGNKKSKSVSIRDRFDKAKKYDFLLLNPLHQENIQIEPKEVPNREHEEEVAELPDIKPEAKFDIKEFNKKAFYINVNGFIGSGKLRYEYETPVDYYPFVQYELNYIPKGFGLEIGYIYKNIQLNFVGAYENMFYYTSTLDTSYEPFVNNQGVEKYPGLTLTNIDFLSTKKYSYGFDLGYNFNMGSKFALVPLLQYTKYDYEENNYNSDIRKEGEIYPLQKRHSIGGGLLMKMMINPKSLITYKITYQHLNFNPVGFFPAMEEVENFQLENEQVLIQLGYTLKLF